MNGYFTGIISKSVLVLLGCWSIATATAQINVSARFEPAIVHAGQPTQFVIQVDGSRSSISYATPAIAGLRVIGGQRNGSSISIINGKTSVQQTIATPMIAEAEGTYTAPAFDVNVGGTVYNVPATELKVLPPDAATQQQSEQLQSIKLGIAVPSGPYYVGQAIPVTLTLSADPQVTILDSSLPKKVGSENYTLSAFADSSMRRAQAGRRIVNEHTFSAVATPLSSGDMEIGFEQTILVRTPARHDAGERGRTNDPFSRIFDVDSVFGGMGNREQLTLSTDKLSLQVTSLPADGRPQGFTGAIGNFRIAGQQLSAKEVNVGEPVTLAIAIDGEGNFDRIQPPVVADSDLWRSYTPQSHFQPQNPLGMSGRKIFEYTLIPRSTEVTATPQIDFNYFDPQSGRYVSIPVAGLPLRVNATAGTTPAEAKQQQGSTARQAQADNTGEDGLLPLTTTAPASTGSNALYLRQPLFYALQGIPAVALVLLILYRRHSLRLAEDPYFARRIEAKTQIRNALSQARSSVQSGNAVAFHEAAEQALKAMLSRDEPHIAAASLTWNDLHARLNARGATPEQIKRAQSFFNIADALRYGSTGATAAGHLPDRLADLEALLRDLDAIPAAQQDNRTTNAGRHRP